MFVLQSKYNFKKSTTDNIYHPIDCINNTPIILSFCEYFIIFVPANQFERQPIMIKSINFTILLPLIILTACNSTNKGNKNVTSIQSEANATAQPLECLPYPDTMMVSANRLHFKIDTMLPNISGELRNINNQYSSNSGILTFRGDPSRQPSFSGTIKGTPSKVAVDWVFYTDYDDRESDFGIWGGGSGWTGQPLYVKWNNEQMSRIRSEASQFLTDAFSNEEIFIGSLCGKVYFIDYKTGKESRTPYDVVNPIKGTMSIDPSMNGNLYIGHGIPCEQPFGAMIINLYNHKLVSMFPKDNNAWKGWGAYDPSPIAVGDFMFRLGENGTIYKLYCDGDSVKLHSTLRYNPYHAGYGSPGIESSLAVSRNYGYFGDNHGNIIAINLDNLKPVWHYSNHDDTDATIVVEEENGTPYIYTGCEIQRQGLSGYSYFVKLNGLNGKLVWEQKIAGRCDSIGGKLREGGMFSSPIIGHGDCEGLIFSNFCVIERGNMGEFVAMDKNTGEIKYRVTLNNYSWSSPIALYNENNEMFIVTGDTSGNLYIIRGKNGAVLLKQHIANNFESSPIIIGNKIVCGSRGREIYKLSIE